MIGILQRLAGEALSAQSKGAQRIRPAASVHAQMPTANQTEVEEVRPMLRPPPQQFAAGTPAMQDVGAVQQAFAGELAPSASASPARERTREPPPIRTTDAATRLNPPPLRESPRERAAEDLRGGTPKPLLDELQIPTAPPSIAPVVTAPPAVVVASQNSSAEPTEVHVHIGRIEVIAAPEPVSTKKNRATVARNTLPLADYLARRRHS